MIKGRFDAVLFFVPYLINNLFLNRNVLGNQVLKVVDDVDIVEVHAFEDFLHIGGAKLEIVVVGGVLDDEVDVLVLADEVAETSSKVALGLQVDVGTLVVGVDFGTFANFRLQVELAVAQFGMEFQQGDAHTNLAFWPRRVESFVYGIHHLLWHSAAVVDNLERQQVLFCTVNHLNHNLRSLCSDRVVNYVNYM